jgi:putative nucleotidyltransferase with HDIG domain
MWNGSCPVFPALAEAIQVFLFSGRYNMSMDSANLQNCLGNHIEGIPTLEASKMRLFDVLQEDDTDIERLEGIISADPAMAAKIVKIANSPFYRHAKGAIGIHQSLLTIGMDMVKCIALSMAVIGSLKSESRHASRLWAHSYATALIALSLSRDKTEKDTLFTGALLHDLGRMVFLFKSPGIYIPLIEFEGFWPDADAEREVFSVDHTLLGEAVARHWNFPEGVAEIIRNHHKPVSRSSAMMYLINHVVCRQEREGEGRESPDEEILCSYLGEMYKDLVNTILQRYKINNVIIENLF